MGKGSLEEYEEERHIVTEGVFRYAAIDEEGRPCRIPDNARFPRTAN
jgi:acyl-CoA thioesterase YciA